jgi:hypothetical protein
MKNWGSIPDTGMKDFSAAARAALGPTQHSDGQYGAFPERSVILATLFRVVPRLEMDGVMPPLRLHSSWPDASISTDIALHCKAVGKSVQRLATA